MFGRSFQIQHGRPMERVWACPKRIFFSGWKVMQNLIICGKQEQRYFFSLRIIFLWINLMTGGFYTKESYEVRLYKLSWSEKWEQIKSFKLLLVVSFNPLRTNLFNEPVCQNNVDIIVSSLTSWCLGTVPRIPFVINVALLPTSVWKYFLGYCWTFLNNTVCQVKG